MWALIEESVVPVASKNTKRGEIPDARVIPAFKVNGPLVPVQEAAAVGAGVPVGALVAALTDTVVDCTVVPPKPVQVRVYLVVAVSAVVALVPLIVCVPLQPPEAVHDVALVAFQVSIAVLPEFICAGVAAMVTVGLGAVAPLELPAGGVPAGGVPAGGVPAGGVPAGGVAATAESPDPVT